MKYNKLTKEQIIISLDRLTRFKNTKEKYFRVFSDILISNLIEPKLKKKDIESMDYSILVEYVSEIFNNSLENSSNFKSELSINSYLAKYENSVFNNDGDTQKLLNNNINYKEAVKLIPENCPVNLKWLCVITKKVMTKQSSNIKQDYSLTLALSLKERERELLKYPIEEVILVEGITEEILLPKFSQLLNYDFYEKGIQIIAAGGKNQVVKKYYELSEQLKLPIFVLLDKDAEENIAQIKPRLRDIDRIHLVSCGEFEDLLPKSLIVKTVNSHFKNFLNITEADLISEQSTAKVLEELFKTKALHEFKKAEFAKLVRENINSEADISSEIRQVIDEIKL